MIRVITIAREYGSGASSISRMLCDRLDWRLLDHELLTEVIRAAEGDPTGDSDLQNDPWFRQLVNGAFRGVGVRGSRWAGVGSQAVRAGVIEEAAGMGNCVVVGRGAQCILVGYPDIFHVFLHAPLPLRLERTIQLLGHRSDIEAVIEQNDNEQADFVRTHFGVNWRAPDLYDLIVDTRHGYQAAAEAILSAAGFKTAARAY